MQSKDEHMFKYEIIARDIEKKILRGEYKADERIPQEYELCEQYDASRITIRKAMDQLVLKGLVAKRRGSGTFVKNVSSPVEDAEGVNRSMQFMGFTQDNEGQVSTVVHEFSVINPPEDVAERLDISSKHFVYYVCRTRFLNGKPYVVEYTYMPIDVISGVTEDVVKGSIYQYIEATLKLKIKSSHRTARADMPTPQEEEWLQIEPGTIPIFEVEQVAYLDDRRIFEYSISRHRADCFELKTVSVRT